MNINYPLASKPYFTLSTATVTEKLFPHKLLMNEKYLETKGKVYVYQ